MKQLHSGRIGSPLYQCERSSIRGRSLYGSPHATAGITKLFPVRWGGFHIWRPGVEVGARHIAFYLARGPYPIRAAAIDVVMQFKPDEIERSSSEIKSESSYLLFQPKRDSGQGQSGWSFQPLCLRSP